jgi:phosphoserine phosphatase RsbU/P
MFRIPVVLLYFIVVLVSYRGATQEARAKFSAGWRVKVLSMPNERDAVAHARTTPTRRRRSARQWVRAIGEGLRTTHPSASSPYWRALPLRRMKRLLLGTFVLSSVAGFALNLVLINHRQLLRGLFWPLLISSIVTVGLVIRLTRPRWAIPFLALACGIVWLAARPQVLSPVLANAHDLEGRLFFNAIGIWLGTGVGSRLLMSFLTTQGAESVRMQTELALAHEIQSMLVPVLSLHTSRFEVYGISLPSTEMGGDLVDAFEKDSDLFAYVADVSGHGLPAGQLMGMLKTAVRLGVELRQEPLTLLESANRTLPSVKQPEMYATLALLRFDKNSAEAEYAIAGHPAIIHYRRATNDTVQLSMQQFPVGLVPNGAYASAYVPFSSGDLFVMLTDGILEVASETGEEFGLGRVESIVAKHAGEPLPKIWETIHSIVAAHGPQRDDQSALLIRVS